MITWIALCSLLCFGLYEEFNIGFNLSNETSCGIVNKIAGCMKVHNSVFALCSLEVCCTMVCIIVYFCGCGGHN